MENRMTPFIKWAGGKQQLIQKLAERVPEQFDTYYEPFIGGGALLLELAPKSAVINDINQQLLNDYIQMRDNVDSLIELIQNYDSVACDKDHYIAMRKRYNEKIQNDENDIESAALMIWLNKHCFNGLYRVNSKGLFNVPYNNKITGQSINPENLRHIGNYLKNTDIEIKYGDFELACSGVKKGDFVYFDSPYVPMSETANFTDYTKEGFSFEDHKRLAALFRRLDSLGAKLMLSNHNVKLVHELYSGYLIEEVDVHRNINSDASKRFGKEVIIRNYGK
jgi:DNA adenine methylase